MWCKLCRKNVRSISHWTREHRAYLTKRAKAGGRHRKSHGRGSHEGRDSRGHFCPQCGKRCRG